MDALYCCFCLVVRKDDLSRAVTIMNGQACCFDHSYYAQTGDFNRILELIKRDEIKKEVKKFEESTAQLKENSKTLRQANRRLGKLF
jgi:hypothetical protein